MGTKPTCPNDAQYFLAHALGGSPVSDNAPAPLAAGPALGIGSEEANAQLQRFENPDTLAKVGNHVAPLVNWGSSSLVERGVALSKVAVAITAVGLGSELVIHAGSAVPMVGTELSGFGIVGGGLWGFTALLRRLGVPTKDLGRATTTVAGVAAGVGTVGATVDAVTYHGAHLLEHMVTECAPAVPIVVSAAAIGLGCSRVARREAQNSAEPSLIDLGNF